MKEIKKTAIGLGIFVILTLLVKAMMFLFTIETLVLTIFLVAILLVSWVIGGMLIN